MFLVHQVNIGMQHHKTALNVQVEDNIICSLSSVSVQPHFTGMISNVSSATYQNILTFTINSANTVQQEWYSIFN